VGFFDLFKREKRQSQLETILLGSTLTDTISTEQALSIPSVSSCVTLITDTIASLPIMLFHDTGDTTKPIEDDKRVMLLNDETNDTLDSFQWKKALITDFLLNGGGYSYINKTGNNVKSLNYVEFHKLNVIQGSDPIFKDYSISVNGDTYRDYQFLKILRKTRNGCTGSGIIAENNKILSVVYNSMIYEEILVKTGGNKRGFLKALRRLSETALAELKASWKNLYANNSENLMILNDGLEFTEASQSSVELQMNEQKKTNSAEIGKIFLVPANILDGTANDEEYANWIKVCIAPILTAFECALNRELLLPSEKKEHYFAFQTDLLLRGDILKRYTAYEVGIKAGFIQIDEVRYKEDLPPLGLKWIKLGLQDVLYFSDSDEIYTPNTNKLAKMGEDPQVDPNQPNQPNNGNMGQVSQNQNKAEIVAK
jgi:HK97 family phage portal protein